MPNFTVLNANGPVIAGMKVVVRRKMDNVIIFSDVTDASGVVNMTILVNDTDYTLLTYKTGAYEGCRISFKQKAGVLKPDRVFLEAPIPPPPPPPMNVQLNLQVYTTTGIPMMGATYLVQTITNIVNQGTVDMNGQVGIAYASVTGYTLTVRAEGHEGVVLHLEDLDLSSQVMVTLNPTIAADE